MKILLRDRQAFGLLFLMPLAFILFLSLALNDVYLAKVGKRLSLDLISTESCSNLKEDICAQLLMEMKNFPYEISFKNRYLDSDHADLVVVLPRHFEETITALQQKRRLTPEQQVTLIFEPTLDQSFRALVSGHLTIALQSVLLSIVKNSAPDIAGGDDKIMKMVTSIPDGHQLGSIVVEKARGGFILPNPIQQTVPAWALFGMFFIVIPLSNSMIRDRRFGIFKRLLSFPITRGELIAGKVFPFYVINILQFVVMFLVGLVVLPQIIHLKLALDFSFAALVIVTLAAAAAATGYGLMIATLAKSPEQASAFGALSVVILAIIGGVMIPRFVMPGFMQTIAQVSPMYWGLEAFQDVMVRKAAMPIVLFKSMVLMGFSFVCCSVAFIKFRWNEG